MEDKEEEEEEEDVEEIVEMEVEVWTRRKRWNGEMTISETHFHNIPLLFGV